MQDERVGSPAGGAPTEQIPVSPNNPCPFLRALVAGGFVGVHTVPLSTLTKTIEAATGEKGLKERLAGLKIRLVALVANGLSPLRLLRSWWSGAQLDELRDGPLDKHGVGSRILNATAHVEEAEIERLAGFGKDREDPSGGRMERGLTAPEIRAFMDANFARAKGNRRWYDRLLMKGEWPVLLDIMGKGDGDQRYLSVDEVRTLFVDRRLPNRIVARLAAQPAPTPPGAIRVAGKIALWAIAIAAVLFVAIVEFPDKAGSILPQFIAQVLPPPLPDVPPTKIAHWLDQNWSTEDRHWFHHASQGTATFPVPYDWFVALEQPGIRLFGLPGLLKDSDYLERFGFIPSPKSVHTDESNLRRFGYSGSSKAPPVPESEAGLRPTQAENFDGLPVGFARLAGTRDPTTAEPEPDRIGLTCAACHAGSIRYKGTSIRFDGGPAMVDLLKLEQATALSILYTVYVPGRFQRFAARVLGPDPDPAAYNQLKKDLSATGDDLLSQISIQKKTFAKDTLEGFGRLDALNRIGNQVFFTDLDLGGLKGLEKNLHARDAPVSFPPIWSVPWFWWAQYDASIEQPLIRNAGEALGVSALINLSPDSPPGDLFRSSVAVENLDRIETMLRGPNPFEQNPMGFAGLKSPKWPSKLFPGDPTWKIDESNVSRGRAIYAEICSECHLGPVDDPVFDNQFPDKSFWSPKETHWQWDGDGPVLNPVQKTVAGMGTDSAQANVLKSRTVDVPGFLDMQPARDLGKVWGCPDIPASPSAEMPFVFALMIAVDRTSRKWMDDHNLSDSDRKKIWRSRVNCPNPNNAEMTHYRARPLNGVWATAPYLHNGSVPSLYWMLKPAAERPKQFCMGLRDFDPQQVGYRVGAGEKPACRQGETLFSATNADGSPIPGNSIRGHSLEGTPGPDKPGVIGRMLTEEERYDLIEYLKTL
jgi:mono/diheme cytochrome c family protein